MTKIFMQAAVLGCTIAGILLWLQGYTTAGVGLVIAGYIFYIAIRLTARARKAKKAAAAEEVPEEEESVPAPDSWETLRRNALEALDRKLRGQKLTLAAFFGPAHAKFAALEKVHDDLIKDAPELTLKTDKEILKLGRSAQETAGLLSEVSARVSSEEDLHREMESLRTKAQA